MFHIYPERHPMDRFEFQPCIVQVDHFGQRVTRGMIHDRCWIGGSALELLPNQLGSGERVIAITHGVKQNRFVGGSLVTLSK